MIKTETINHQQALNMLSDAIMIFPHINNLLFKMGQLLELNHQLSSINHILAKNSDALYQHVKLLRALPNLANERDIILLQKEKLRLTILIGMQGNRWFSFESSDILYEYQEKLNLNYDKQENIVKLNHIIDDYMMDMIALQEDFKGSEYILKQDLDNIQHIRHDLYNNIKDVEAANLAALTTKQQLLKTPYPISLGKSNSLFSKL